MPFASGQSFATTRFLLVIVLCLSGWQSASERTFAADTAGSKPATVAEAAAVLDLTKFPVPKGTEEPVNRQIAGLTYQTKGTAKQAFEVVKKQLTDQKWKELPNSQEYEGSASATFSRNGFVVSLSTYKAGKPESVRVSLMHLGNVDTQKLPVPPKTKLLSGSPFSSMFVAEAPVEATLATCRKLLVAQGWEPYGSAGDTINLKQNAVQLMLRVVKAEGLGGKTTINFNTTLMSVDLPAMPKAETVQYADTTRRLWMEIPGSQEEVVAFYKERLAKQQWKATTENVVVIDRRNTMIFRNPAKDMLTLLIHDFEGKTRAELIHQTAAELEALEAQYEAAKAKKTADKLAEKSKKLPKLSLKLPSGAEEVEATKKRIEFKVATGKAKAAFEVLRKQLSKDGWKEEVMALEDLVGVISFKKEGQELTIEFTDTGVMPAEFQIDARNVELEQAK